MKPSRVLWLAALCLSGPLAIAAQTDAGPQVKNFSASAQVTVTARVTDAAQVAFAMPPELSAGRDESETFVHHTAPRAVNNFTLDLAAAHALAQTGSSKSLRVEARRGGWWYSLPMRLTVRSVGLAETAAPFAVSVTASDEPDAPDAETFVLPAGETTVTPRLGFFVSEKADNKPLKIRLIYRALLP